MTSQRSPSKLQRVAPGIGDLGSNPSKLLGLEPRSPNFTLSDYYFNVEMLKNCCCSAGVNLNCTWMGDYISCPELSRDHWLLRKYNPVLLLHAFVVMINWALPRHVDFGVLCPTFPTYFHIRIPFSLSYHKMA